MKKAKCNSLIRHVLIVFAAVISMSASVWASQPDLPPASVSDSLSLLEDRLFERDYHTDSESERLARLEEFVFGDRQSGSMADRLKNLNAVAVEFVAAKKGASTKDASTGEGKTSPSFAYTNYPRVAELEKHMIGTSYANEALTERLARLETKAFGAPSTSTDLCQRVDRLDEYADRHDIYHERNATLSTLPSGMPIDQVAPVNPLNIATNAAPQGANPFLNGAPGSEEPTERLAVIEQVVFGHTDSDRSEQERLKRLEKKIVPWQHDLDQKDLTSRVNSLWNMLKVANTMNQTAISRQSNSLIAANQSRMANDGSANTLGPTASARRSWLHGLSKAMDSGDSSPGLTQMGFPGANTGGMPLLPGTPAQNGATWGF